MRLANTVCWRDHDSRAGDRSPGLAMLRITHAISTGRNRHRDQLRPRLRPGRAGSSTSSPPPHELRFDARRAALPPDVGARLGGWPGSVTKRWRSSSSMPSVIAPRSATARTQIERLVDLLRDAAVRPTPRRATKPTLARKQRRPRARRSAATSRRVRGGRFDD